MLIASGIFLYVCLLKISSTSLPLFSTFRISLAPPLQPESLPSRLSSYCNWLGIRRLVAFFSLGSEVSSKIIQDGSQKQKAAITDKSGFLLTDSNRRLKISKNSGFSNCALDYTWNPIVAYVWTRYVWEGHSSWSFSEKHS